MLSGFRKSSRKTSPGWTGRIPFLIMSLSFVSKN